MNGGIKIWLKMSGWKPDDLCTTIKTKKENNDKKLPETDL